MESMKAQGKSEGLDELRRELGTAWSKADLKQILETM